MGLVPQQGGEGCIPIALVPTDSVVHCHMLVFGLRVVVLEIIQSPLKGSFFCILKDSVFS